MDKNGEARSFDARDYADMVFQTAGAEAANIATVERLEKLGIDLLKIIGSNSPNFCTAYVGKVYSISGKHPEYPALSTLPRGGAPFHPRCTKHYVAFNEQRATAVELDKAKPDETTEKLKGKSGGEAQRVFNNTPPKRATVPVPPLPSRPTPGADLPNAVEFDRRLARDQARGQTGFTDPAVVGRTLGLSTAQGTALVHGVCPNIDNAFPNSPYIGGSSWQGEIEVSCAGSGRTETKRRLFRDKAGKLVCEAQLFRLDDSLQGQGLGRKIFTEMAEQLASVGFDRIEAIAARDDDPDGFVGYVVWPKLGYDRALDTLPPPIQDAIEDGGEQVAGRTLLDLMSTDSGLELWKDVGVTVKMTFDLKPGSKSWMKLRKGEKKP